ncbi:MAG: hypothetical protein ACOYL3_21370 [Desulfuromonadaceae bacterium]
MNYLKVLAVLNMMLLLTACGSGGGSALPFAPVPAPAPVSSVEGVASKGLIAGGAVKIYAVSDAGVKRSLLAETVTDAKGHYKVAIGSYVGAVLVEVTGGSYEDEATHKTVQNSPTLPLRALYPDVAYGTTTLQVTALTELAAVRVGPAMTPTAIRDANTLVSKVMKVDILSTAPVSPTSADFAAVTQAQRDYSLLLAAVSQLMLTTGSTMDATLASLNNGLSSSSGMSEPTATALSGALTTYVAANSAQTGVTAVPPALQNIGTVTKKLTLSLNTPKASSVQAITTVITLPAGLLVSADAAGVPTRYALSLAGSSTAAKNINYAAKYVAATGTNPAIITISLLAPESGLTEAGDILFVICDVAPGSTAPAASAVTLKTEFKDLNGALLTGPTLSVY